jgi:hypothetical protein
MVDSKLGVKCECKKEEMEGEGATEGLEPAKKGRRGTHGR